MFQHLMLNLHCLLSTLLFPYSMLNYVNLALFYVALLMLDYFNVALFDVALFYAALFVVTLLNVALF